MQCHSLINLSESCPCGANTLNTASTSSWSWHHSSSLGACSLLKEIAHQDSSNPQGLIRSCLGSADDKHHGLCSTWSFGLPLVSGELAGALPREDPDTPSLPIGQNNKQQSKLLLRGPAGSKAGPDHGSLRHPAPHYLHWPPALLGPPCLLGPPPSWTLASSLPGECLANGPEGPPQVFPGGEMERTRGVESLKKGLVTHSSIFVWRFPWTEEPGWLHSMRSQRVGHNRVTNTFILYIVVYICYSKFTNSSHSLSLLGNCTFVF